MAKSQVYAVATDTRVNAALLIMLAIYLAAVIVRGNVVVFSQALWGDFSGAAGANRGQQRPAFWQWALAVLVLYALAQYPQTQGLFGPLLGIVIVAMLIQLAMKQPQIFSTLDSSIKSLFGGS